MWGTIVSNRKASRLLSGHQVLFAAVLKSHLLPTQQCRLEPSGAIAALHAPRTKAPAPAPASTASGRTPILLPEVSARAP
jgi:hypothetical protein